MPKMFRNIVYFSLFCFLKKILTRKYVFREALAGGPRRTRTGRPTHPPGAPGAAGLFRAGLRARTLTRPEPNPGVAAPESFRPQPSVLSPSETKTESAPRGARGARERRDLLGSKMAAA